jgi:hypothetical protein
MMQAAAVGALSAAYGPEGAAAELARQGDMSLGEAKEFMAAVQRAYAVTRPTFTRDTYINWRDRYSQPCKSLTSRYACDAKTDGWRGPKMCRWDDQDDQCKPTEAMKLKHKPAREDHPEFWEEAERRGGTYPRKTRSPRM